MSVSISDYNIIDNILDAQIARLESSSFPMSDRTRKLWTSHLKVLKKTVHMSKLLQDRQVQNLSKFGELYVDSCLTGITMAQDHLNRYLSKTQKKEISPHALPKKLKKLAKKSALALSLSLIPATGFAVQPELLAELGFTKIHAEGFTGKGVPVVLTDMPVLTSHKAFGGEVKELYSAPQNPKSMQASEGGPRVHGTHTSSIIKAQPNKETGDKGAAFDVSLKTIGVPLGIDISSEDAKAVSSKLLEVLEQQSEIKLISMSHTVPNFDEDQLNLFERILLKHDCGLIVAAGNNANTLLYLIRAIAPDKLDVENSQRLLRFYNRPTIRERMLIVGNGSKEDMSEEDFLNLFNSSKARNGIRWDNDTEKVLELMGDFLKENDLTFQELIKIEDDLTKETITEVLGLWPDDITHDQYEEKRKSSPYGLTIEEMKSKYPTIEESRILERYDKQTSKREELYAAIETEYKKNLQSKRSAEFAKILTPKVVSFFNDLMGKNERTKEIVDLLFEKRSSSENSAHAFFRWAKTQLYSHSSSVKERLRLFSATPNTGILNGSNRAGDFEDRFITTIGAKVQGASFERVKDLETGEHTGFKDVYEKESGTSFATPLVTSALALILQKYPTITVPKAMNLLLDSAKPTDYPWLFGRGIMDLPKAMSKETM